MSDKNESTEAQNKLIEEFEKVSTKLRHMADDPDCEKKLNIMVNLQQTASEMLSTYKDVENLHANARIKEAEARIAEAKVKELEARMPKFDL